MKPQFVGFVLQKRAELLKKSTTLQKNTHLEENHSLLPSSPSAVPSPQPFRVSPPPPISLFSMQPPSSFPSCPSETSGFNWGRKRREGKEKLALLSAPLLPLLGELGMGRRRRRDPSSSSPFLHCKQFLFSGSFLPLFLRKSGKGRPPPLSAIFFPFPPPPPPPLGHKS